MLAASSAALFLALILWRGNPAAAQGTPGLPVGQEAAIRPTLYILAVGIAKYDDPSLQLAYPAKDANDFVHVMQGQKGRLYKDVFVYHDKALTDGDATKDNILDGLDWLNKQTTNNDVAMIFLCGHGGSDSEEDYFFVPVGSNRERILSTGLPSRDIVATARHIAGKVVFFCDSSHSGNVLGSGFKGAPGIDGIVNELSNAENGLVVFTSSTGSESSYESADWGNGAFTKAVDDQK